MIGLLLGVALAQTCEQPVGSAEVADALESAALRFADADVEGFEEQASAALEQVVCVGDPLEPRLVAELHRAAGLLAFVRRDVDQATTAFAAARSLEPDYVFPTSILPQTHPIREQYSALDPEKGKTELVGEPKTGRVSFDAESTLRRPSDRPTVFQRYEAGGGVADTAYLWPADPLPSYEAKLPPSPLVKPLWLGSGAAAVVSAGLLGAAAASRAGFDNLAFDTSEGQARIDPARARTNALLLSSGVVLGVGVGSGAGALALTRW